MPEKEVRLVDANALESALEATNIAVAVDKSKMFRLIEKAPTITHESLRPKGKWLETIEELGWQEVRCFECSVCGESWLLDEEWSIEEIKASHNYCPNCGAKMEGE